MVSNHFETEFNNIAIQNYNFLPYYEIRTLIDIPKNEDGEFLYDIFQNTFGDEEEVTAGWDSFLSIDY